MPRRSASHTRLLNGEHSLTDCGDCGTSEALVDSREQVIRDRLNDINSVDSNNATNFFTLPTGSNGKGFSDILSNNTTSFTLSAAATSSTLTVTLQAYGHTAVDESTTMEGHIGQFLVKGMFELLHASLYFLVGLESRRDSILTGR